MQKIFDKTLSQKLESFEQVQSRFVRDVSQKVEENAKQNKQELGEAAKIEKRYWFLVYLSALQLTINSIFFFLFLPSSFIQIGPR